jgi:hypothetical protein
VIFTDRWKIHDIVVQFLIPHCACAQGSDILNYYHTSFTSLLFKNSLQNSILQHGYFIRPPILVPGLHIISPARSALYGSTAIAKVYPDSMVSLDYYGIIVDHDIHSVAWLPLTGAILIYLAKVGVGAEGRLTSNSITVWSELSIDSSSITFLILWL